MGVWGRTLWAEAAAKADSGLELPWSEGEARTPGWWSEGKEGRGPQGALGVLKASEGFWLLL